LSHDKESKSRDKLYVRAKTFEVLCNLSVFCEVKLRFSIGGKKRQKGQQWTDKSFLILVIKYMKHPGSVWFTLVQYFLGSDTKRWRLHPTEIASFGSVWFSTFKTRHQTVPVIFDENEMFQLVWFGSLLDAFDIPCFALRPVHPRKRMYSVLLCVLRIRTVVCFFYCFYARCHSSFTASSGGSVINILFARPPSGFWVLV